MGPPPPPAAAGSTAASAFGRPRDTKYCRSRASRRRTWTQRLTQPQQPLSPTCSRSRASVARRRWHVQGTRRASRCTRSTHACSSCAARLSRCRRVPRRQANARRGSWGSSRACRAPTSAAPPTRRVLMCGLQWRRSPRWKWSTWSCGPSLRAQRLALASGRSRWSQRARLRRLSRTAICAPSRRCRTHRRCRPTPGSGSLSLSTCTGKRC
mmetsp:Transcript_43627/g.130814  ORF Transcript_43627/g.130814 Transcript_43627/m.130814 type:complete len:211 (+) Transcript_43627:1347-1979(+)